MTDTVKAWVEERRAIHAPELGEAWSNYGTPPFEIYDSTKYADGDMGEVHAETRALKVSHAIVDAHNTLPSLLTAVEKVLELHKPEAFEDAYSMQSGFMCESCYDPDKNEWVEWPCETVQAIEGAINE